MTSIADQIVLSCFDNTVRIIDLNQTILSDFENQDVTSILEHEYIYLWPIDSSRVLTKLKNEKYLIYVIKFIIKIFIIDIFFLLTN